MGEQDDKVKPTKVAYVLYYCVLFFAYWFGASRFDVDGDGDFDPEDVEAYLEDHGFLHKNMQRTKKPKGAAKDALKDAPKEKAEGVKAKKGGKTAEPERPAATEKPPEHAEHPEHHHEHHHHLADFLDRDGDGEVGIGDLIETKVDGEAEEDIAMNNLRTGQIVPFFMLIECSLVVLLWLIPAIIKAADGEDFLTVKAGLDSISDMSTDLRFAGPSCEDNRPEVYRWLTYQFTHVGLVHMLMNVLLNIFLGVPLEGVHGHLRMFVMFNAGVLGGAMCNMVIDQHTAVVGCSGGCYSLIGIHLADLILNWSQKKFRLPTLFFIGVLIATDIVFNYGASNTEDVSHAAHLGGGISGLLVGMVVIRNLRVERCERIIIDVALLLALFWTIFSLAWLYSQTTGPRSIWEAMAGQPGWCWHRAMMDHTIQPYEWRCVRCGTESCVQRWLAFNATESKVIRAPALQAYAFKRCEELGWFDMGP